MSFENFFRNNAIVETTFFDEGPRIINSKQSATVTGSFASINSSSITTVDIDSYRQGVELTQMKHFDAGIAKIHAGEPGHVLRRNRFGMSQNFRFEAAFKELDYFDPKLFLLSQQESPLLLNILTFPIITGDNDQFENYTFDGIIEPLLIREIASFFSIETPFYSRTVKGSMMGGNNDQTESTDNIVTVDYIQPEKHQSEFIDGFYQFTKATIKPFNDVRYPRNVKISTNYDVTMDSALSIMSGSTDNYISFKQKSQTAGFDYGSPTGINLTGTDSIAFIGMTY